MLAFLIALSFVALLILLPLTTSMRLLRLHRDLEELRERVAALEGERRSSAAPAAPNAPDAPSAPSSPDAPDLEQRIGGRGLLYAGVLVLLFGVAFFLRYAFDNDWIDELGRVVIGSASGLALVWSGTRLAERDLRTFGHALIGTGIAILYLSTYSALNMYALVGPLWGFVMMGGITALTAVMADRQRSQPLAFIAVGGGFLTPFLVGGTADAQLTLFTYDALLIAGTLVLARRHDWFLLNAASYVLTVITVLAWMSEHYRDRTWLRTFLFLTLFCVMFIQILRDTRRSRTAAARAALALLATAPMLYHFAAVILTAGHPPAIHIYIIAFSAVGLWLTADPLRPGWRFVVLLASYAPLFGPITLPLGLSWMMPNTITVVAVAALHLLAPLDRVFRQDEHLEKWELVALHVAAIGLFGLLDSTLQPFYPEFGGALAAILALGAIALWQLLQPRDPDAALNAAAIAFTLAALAVAVQFDGRAVVVGWAAEGAAATWLGLRAGSNVFQIGGLALWGLAVARLFDGYFITPTDFTAIFNVRALTTAFVVALAYTLAWLFARYRDGQVESGPFDSLRVLRAGRTRAVLHVIASLITLAAITAEVRSYWEVRDDTSNANLYEQLILSLAYGVYGAVLIVSGMRRSYAPDRYIGIAVLAFTVLKVFFRDLWELGGIYRVIAFIVFGVLLVGVSYLYQRRKGPTPRQASDALPPTPEPTAQSDHQA